MYPPEYHVENDKQKSYRVIEECSFATVISKTEDDVIVTQLPLMLDKSRGKKGFLVGHLDRNNPHVPYLTEGSITVIFHGPNTYISPTVYQSSQLPTWNSISVHIKGKVSTLDSNEKVRDSIIHMTDFLEQGEERFVLDKNNQKMAGWLNYIVGFEIEITELVGRFKLSQDKSAEDMQLAKQHLINKSNQGSADLISDLL